MVVAHLISRRSENDSKRLAQASVIRRHIVKAIAKGRHVIVMGDMNDTPETPVLRRLRWCILTFRGPGSLFPKLKCKKKEIFKSNRAIIIKIAFGIIGSKGLGKN